MSDGQYRKGGKTTIQALQRTPRRKKFEVNGVVFQCYGVTWLAATMNVHSAHVRLMERRGVLPPPLLNRTADNFRWYLPAEVLGYSKLYQKHAPMKNGGYIKSGFKEAVWKFRTKLRAMLKNDLGNVYTSLPFESDVLKIMTDKKETKSNKWKLNIDSLIQ